MRYLRRKRGLAAVTAALLLVPAALAADGVSGWSADERSIVPLANGLGRGFFGIDLDDLGASGELPEVGRLSDELMRMAGDPDALASAGDPINTPSGPLGIPSTAMLAYKKAESLLAVSQPGCKLHWSLLASIGRIESNHGRGGQVDSRGYTIDRILGPVLNGNGFAAIQDTDSGALDGDLQWDRAVGPMQFIPSTWRGYASDGNGDGVSSPHNFYDAALAAGKYLCSGGFDLSNDQNRSVAVFRYNHSESYVRTVLLWAKAYEAGVSEIPPGTGGGTTPNYDPNAQAAPPPAQNQQPTPTPAPTPAPTPTPTPSPSKPPPSHETTVTPKPPSPTKTMPSNPSSPSNPPSCQPTPSNTPSPSASNTPSPSASESQQPSSGTNPASASSDSDTEDPCKPE